MFFNEKEWENITNYLKLQIREYCAKNALDIEDFAKKLGLSSRVVSRFYCSKTNGGRNNRFLSSLEFLYTLAKSLEIDVMKMFSEINLFTYTAKNQKRNTSKLTDKIKLIKLVDKDIVKIFNNQSNRKERRNNLSKHLNLAIILMYIKKSSMKKILFIIENEEFDGLSISNKETFTQYLKLNKNDF